MKQIITILIAIAVTISANAKKYNYTFHNTTVSQALVKLSQDHRDINIAFIYDELDNYRTSANIDTEKIYDAIREIIGLNPVSVIQKKNHFYIEALQHGKYIYNGCAVGADMEPVAAATVIILSPNDSTVITYGVTDDNGRFSIPCDRKNVIGKITCLGYMPVYRDFNTFNIGVIEMSRLPVTLNPLTVKEQNSNLYADKSVYIPTNRQKKASQTGTDLLNHMAIPQLGIISGGKIATNAGKPVAVFIDYLPATEQDLQAMLTTDVKKVEYYEYPSDPRLQGNHHAINFIMRRYEYGGYLKALEHTNLISNPVGELNVNLRFQHKKMTYDVMGSTLSL